MKLNLFTTFHLNLAYSSIEESQRFSVIRRCYWPLLRLARDLNFPLGIEAPAYTLEVAAALDPAWFEELRELVNGGPCEFIGSGYAQLIGPLVPAEVNAANLLHGNQVYEQLLGFRPRVALVNEQAYAAGLVSHYRDAGYEAIIMEWENPAKHHPGWNPLMRYYPQRVVGADGSELPLIWNQSVAFQKLQRYAHGEMEIDEYLEYLGGHVGGGDRVFALYGNDAEIFDFRPGRFQTEAELSHRSEWERIGFLFKALDKDVRFQLVLPSAALQCQDALYSGRSLRLETPEDPVPVKKQGKYNVTRWAVTGRNDLAINTACWRIAKALRGRPWTDPGWKELCYLWSSDFRTHITSQRWDSYVQRLQATHDRVVKPVPSRPATTAAPLPSDVRVVRSARFLEVETPTARLAFNCRRGLCMERYQTKAPDSPSLFGTLPHGFFDDIAMAADYYSGDVVLELPGRPKVADLNPVEPRWAWDSGRNALHIQGTIPTTLGPVRKQWWIACDRSSVELEIEIDWGEIPPGALRIIPVTLDPRAFDEASLYYETHNGGQTPERFSLAGRQVDHGVAPSMLISAATGMGVTEGMVAVGDSRHRITLEVDRSASALLGLISKRTIGPSFFCQVLLSARELDETSAAYPLRREDVLGQPLTVRMCLAIG